MSTPLKIGVALVSLLVVALLAVLLIGWRLPVKHSTTRAATYPVQPESLFAVITAFDSVPAWRPSVKSVLRVDRGVGVVAYQEVSSDGAILYEVTEAVPPRRLVTRIADPSLPFGGTWTFELSPDANGVSLRITEDGEVYNPIFRFASRYIFSHHAGIELYLTDLATRFGVVVTPTPSRAGKSHP